MNIEKHINNLKEYIETDFAFKEPEKNESDFDKFCYNHCKDIDAVINELDKVEADLYEANNRITDLLLILGDRDRMIDLMATWIDEHEDPFEDCHENNISCADIECKDCIRKYFEERCK